MSKTWLLFVPGFTYQAPRGLGGNDLVTQGYWRSQNCSWGLLLGWAGWKIVWGEHLILLSVPLYRVNWIHHRAEGTIPAAACMVQIIFSASMAFLQLMGLSCSVTAKGQDSGGRAKFKHLDTDQPCLPSVSFLCRLLFFFFCNAFFSPALLRNNWHGSFFFLTVNLWGPVLNWWQENPIFKESASSENSFSKIGFYFYFLTTFFVL